MVKSTMPQEVGLHIVWLVDIPDETVASYHPNFSSSDFNLGRISPGYFEWRALFFDVLHADTGPLIPADTDPREFVSDIAGFPMLSRITGRIYDARYTRSEVAELRQECVTVKASCSNVKALAALDKLTSACDAALERNMALILQGD